MKVLHAFNQDQNPYVEVIQNRLIQHDGIELTGSTEPFWRGRGPEYDLVHIQWPETLFNWRCPTDLELDFLEERLAALSGKTPVVYTYHNQASHHRTPETAERLDRLYRLVLQACDAVVHLGPVTRDQLASSPEGAGKTHAMIPIPVYDEAYRPHLSLSKNEARQQLGLPRNRKIIVSFGNFRTPDELRLVEQAYRLVPHRNTLLYAPKWFRPREYGFTFRHPLFTLRSALKQAGTLRQGIRARAWKYMDDPSVAACFAAADVVLIPRVKDINSGNLPMACLFGKVMAGPDIGNIGHWLRTCGNPVFSPTDPAAAAAAIQKALKLADTPAGSDNRTFALEHWNTARIASAHRTFYHQLSGA